MYFPARPVVVLLMIISFTAPTGAAMNAIGVEGFCAAISADVANKTDGDKKPQAVDDEQPECE